MRENFTDEGIVLRRVDYSESDRIITLLTKQHGKVGAIARGARKPTSTLSVATDLYIHGNFEIVHSKGDLLVIAHATILDSFRTEVPYATLLAASACAELCERLIYEEYVDEIAFGILHVALTAVQQGGNNESAAVVFCGLSLLVHLGYSPIVDRCAMCENELPEEQSWLFVPRGGLICGSCHEKIAAGIPAPVRVIKVLRLLCRGEGSLFFRVKLGQEDVKTLLHMLEALVIEHSSRPFHALAALTH